MTKTGMAIATCAIALMACSKSLAAKPSPSASVAASSAPRPPVLPASTTVVPFEGEIVMNVKDEAAAHVPTSITYSIKSDKIRAVPAAPAHVYTIVDGTTQHAYAVDDTQKTYADFAGATDTTLPAKVAKTQKVETVAGLVCEDWSIDDANGKVDVCVAKGVAFFDFARAPKAGATEPSWAAALTQEKAFPLRVVAHDRAGKEVYRAEATKVDRKSVADSLFQLPTGFGKRTASDGIASAELP